MKSHDPKAPNSIREQLARAQPEARYDVDSGLAKHQQLVAAQAPTPAWAASLPRLRRGRLAWPLSLLTLTGLVAVFSLSLPEPTKTRNRSESAAVAREAAPTLEVRAPGARAELVRTESRAKRSAAPAEDVAAGVAAKLKPRSAPPRAGAARAASLGTKAPASETERESDALPESSAPAAEPKGPALEQPERAPVEPLALPPVAASQGTSAPEAIDPEVLAEMRELALAERLLASAPERSLAIVRAGMQRFASGYLVQERRYVEIMALFALGKKEDAALFSRVFLRDYPRGPYRRKVEQALSAPR